MVQTAPAAPPTVSPRPWRRRLRRWLIMAAISYVGVVFVLWLFENALVYHPAKGRDEAALASLNGKVKVEDVELTTAGGTRVHGYWVPTPDARGALLYCHGNAGNASHRVPPAAKIGQALQLSVLVIDYPGYGLSEGKPSEAGCYAAADAAFDWLVQRVPAEQIVLYGASLGGGVVVDLATRRPHRALVLMKTFTSLPDVGQRQYPWVPVRWIMSNRFDNLAKIGKCSRPIFVAHGDCDELIPLSHSERLFAAAPEPKRFHLLRGCGHNDPAPADCVVALAEFLRSTGAP